MGATWTPKPSGRVQPLRRRYRAEQLDVDALSVYGYRGRCDCGWTGPRWGTVAEARAELRAHVAEAHP